MASVPDQASCTPPSAASGGAQRICLQPPAHGTTEVRSDAASVLAQRQFRHHHSNWFLRIPGWVDRVVGRLLADLVSSNGLTVAGLVVASALIVAGLVLAARFARGVKRDPAFDVTTRRPRRKAVDWTQEAVGHEAKGEWRQALRCHYRALVAELADRDVLDEIPGRTSHEYALQVAERIPQAADAFGAVSAMFEAVWYGFEPTGPVDLERFHALATSVSDEARRATRPLALTRS